MVSILCQLNKSNIQGEYGPILFTLAVQMCWREAFEKWWPTDQFHCGYLGLPRDEGRVHIYRRVIIPTALRSTLKWLTNRYQS